MQTGTKRVFSRTNLLTAAAFAALAVTGCADVSDAEESASESEVTEVRSTEQALQASGTTTVRDPNGVYFAEVSPFGTGCPLGSTETSISDDGQVFTVTFSKYFTDFSPTKSPALKDCAIRMKLHSPNGLSYSVSDFSYQGYAVLEKGASVKLIAAYSFQGLGTVALDSSKKIVNGPFDGPYTFTDTVTTQQLNWSPCGLTRDLNVKTNLSVTANKTSGYVGLTSMDGSTKGKIIFRLNTKNCK